MHVFYDAVLVDLTVTILFMFLGREEVKDEAQL